MSFNYLFFGLALCVLIWVSWRFASYRWVIPCPVWLHWLLEYDNPLTRANQTSVILSNLALAPGMNVLDAGCGPGRLTIPLAKKIGVQGKVTALDIQAGMLQKVQEKASREGIHTIQVLQAGLGDGKLGHNQYDRALLVTVLGEIPHQKAAMQEIFDALKPGGIVVVTESMFDPHFQSQSTVLRLAQEVGFRKKGVMGNRLAYSMQLEKPH